MSATASGSSREHVEPVRAEHQEERAHTACDADARDVELEHQQHEPDRQHQVGDRWARDGVQQARQQVELREPHLRDRLAAGAVRALDDLRGVQSRAVHVETVEPHDELAEHGGVEVDDARGDRFGRSERRAAPLVDRRLVTHGERGGVERIAEVADATARRDARDTRNEQELPAALVRAGTARPDPDRDRHLGRRDVVEQGSHLVVVDDGLLAVELDDERLDLLALRAVDRVLDEVGLDGVEQAGDFDHVDRRDLWGILRACRMRDEEGARGHEGAEGGAHPG